MLRLHGVYRSRAARNVWLLNEIGVPFEHLPVIQAYRLTEADLVTRSHTQTDAFKTLSPAAAIPVLEDGDLVLTESMAINLYLARTYGGDLGPRDARETALMEQWSFYAIAGVEPLTLPVIYADAATEAGRAEIVAAAENLRRPFAVLDQILAGTGWLVGDRFTVADINMAEVVRYAMPAAGLIEEFSNLHAWLTRLHARPAFQKMWQARAAEAD